MEKIIKTSLYRRLTNNGYKGSTHSRVELNIGTGWTFPLKGDEFIILKNVDEILVKRADIDSKNINTFRKDHTLILSTNDIDAEYVHGTYNVFQQNIDTLILTKI